MKKVLAFLLMFLLTSPAFSEEIITVDELETIIGIDIEATSASDLKTILAALDEVLDQYMEPYDQYRSKILNSLAQKGEIKWIQAYLSSQNSSVDIIGMSYTDLINLKNDINLAIWMSNEWQEVTVPQGTWKVGEDIPAGHWTVKCTDTVTYATISWGERLDENGQDISYLGKSSTHNSIYNPKYYENRDRYPVEYSFEVVDGDYIQIKNGSVVFMPYVGKPSFDFK